MIQPLVKAFCVFILSWCLTGCGFLLAENDKDDDPEPASTGEPVEPPPPLELPAKPPYLSAARALRRLSLDANNRLPALSEMNAITANPHQFSYFVDLYLNNGNSSKALAKILGRVWDLRADRLPDLDRFVREGNSTLETALTTAIRTGIRNEPLNLIRHVLDQDLGFLEIFTADYTIASPSVLGLWGLSGLETVWEGEGLQVARYADGRLNLGILSTNGFLASYNSRNDSLPHGRYFDVMRALTCTGQSNPDVHRFYTLTPEELAQDLSALATGHRNCRGCHGQPAELARLLRGIGSGDSFSHWVTNQDGQPPQTGTYAGHPFSTPAALANYLARDPRVHRCLIQKLINYTFQRPVVNADTPVISAAIQKFETSNYQLKTLFAAIFSEDQYRYDAPALDQAGELLRIYSGIRFLRQGHWEGIIAQLVPGNTSIVVPDSLQPGYDAIEKDYHYPIETYFHDTRRVARQLAKAIVDRELADNTLPASRVLLTLLPTGANFDITGVQFQDQIIKIWLQLTGFAINADNPLIASLINIYGTALTGTPTVDTYRLGWEIVLASIFLHHDFMTY